MSTTNTEDMRQHFEADGSPARIDGGTAGAHCAPVAGSEACPYCAGKHDWSECPVVYTPITDCEYKDVEDGCCSHPKNMTPECHFGACPRLNRKLTGSVDHMEKMLRAIDAATDLETARRRANLGLNPQNK